MSWKIVSLGSVCNIRTGKKDVNEGNQKGIYPFFTCAEKHTYSDVFSFDCEAILIAGNGAVGQTSYYKGKFEAYQRTYVLSNFEGVSPPYLLYVLKARLMNELSSKVLGNTIPYIKKGMLTDFQVPLPSLAIQQKIVEKLDAIFGEIDKASAAAEANVKNAEALFQCYLTQVFEQGKSSWQIKYLNDIAENFDSKRIPITKGVRSKGDIPYYGASGIVDYVKDYIFDENILLVSEDGANLLARTYPIAFSVTGKSWVNNHAHVLKFPNIFTQKFVEFYLNSISLKPYVSGMAQPKLNQTMLNKIPIPLPEIEVQKKLVNCFENLKSSSLKLKATYESRLASFVDLRTILLREHLNLS